MFVLDLENDLLIRICIYIYYINFSIFIYINFNEISQTFYLLICRIADGFGLKYDFILQINAFSNWQTDVFPQRTSR